MSDIAKARLLGESRARGKGFLFPPVCPLVWRRAPEHTGRGPSKVVYKIDDKLFESRDITAIKTTRLAGGLLFGYNPRKAGARLKTPAFALFRPYCP